MGDSRRFDLFADRIADRFAPNMDIVDVAAGKGLLQAALRERGFARVVSWDRRPRYAAKAHRARFYRHGAFDCRGAPRGYDLAVGMHPDEATDHIVQYAIRCGVPFAVCPCCVLPSAIPYSGPTFAYGAWCHHLVRMAKAAGFAVEVDLLPMRGANLVVIGVPPGWSHAHA